MAPFFKGLWLLQTPPAPETKRGLPSDQKVAASSPAGCTAGLDYLG
jgi:hypothetical protein